MNGPAQYLHIGFILISVANLIVIALLIWREYYRDVRNVRDERMVEGVSPGPAP
jgi:hypothetical protein